MGDWEIIFNQAGKFFEANVEWISLGERVSYCFDEVNEDNIIVKRIYGGQPAKISRKSVEKSLKYLKEHKYLPQKKFIKSVARQTALEVLHPNVVYDKDSKTINWTEKSDMIDNFKKFVEEAKDDELQKIQVWVNQRKNQSKFKLNLLKKYNSQCLISKIKIPELIEAAHIYPHSKSGQNNVANGILLRSDLHILFDYGLLSINPENFNVIIDKFLEKTEYQKFHDLKVDLPEESKEFLRLKQSHFQNENK